MIQPQSPFGDYIFRRIEQQKHEVPTDLRNKYATFSDASDLDSLIEASCALQRYLDENLDLWPKLLGGSVTPFSTFRGNFLEEVVLRLARSVVNDAGVGSGIDTVKLSTGQGIITGVSLQFSRDLIPEPVKVALRRDREDVTIGFRRTVVVEDQQNGIARFPDEIIPVCIIACKMYIDATRLENVTAKARNLTIQHAGCACLVAADWDALGQDWHDERGRVLDSLCSPVEDIVFLRGDDARRPDNSQLRTASLTHPYRSAQIERLAAAIRLSLKNWVAKTDEET